MEKTKLIIADDHNLFLEGLLSMLTSERDMEVMAIANDGKELLELLHKNKPDVVLLDINMPGMNGIEAARILKRQYPSIKLVMLSTYNEEHLVEKAKTFGAHGYLLKNANKEELMQAIRQVNQGQRCFPVKKIVEPTRFSEIDPFLQQFNLTRREMELLQLIKQDLTNQQIADQLHLSIYTVETHRKNIMQKLKLKKTVELTRFIIQHNL